MKKLICEKDIENANKEGKKVFYIQKDAIVTPAAKDAAKIAKIEILIGEPSCENEEIVELENICEVNTNNLDSEMLLNLFNSFKDKSVLTEIFESITNPKPYVCENAANNIKVVRGDSVKFDVFDTGNPHANVSYQELISKEESSMSAGFLVIENSKFDWELTYEEIDYVIEGTLTITIDGKTLTAHAGDVLNIPSGSKVTWGSPDKTKIFYVTYPANWADLL